MAAAKRAACSNFMAGLRMPSARSARPGVNALAANSLARTCLHLGRHLGRGRHIDSVFAEGRVPPSGEDLRTKRAAIDADTPQRPRGATCAPGHPLLRWPGRVAARDKFGAGFGSVRHSSFEPDECPALVGGDKAIEHFVDLVPGFELLHGIEPARNVGVDGEVTADQLANRDQGGPEIIGDGELVTAQILSVWPKPMIVEDLQPILGTLLPPGDGAGMRFVAAPLVVR